MCIACQQRRRNHVARVAGIGTAGNRGNDDRAIRQQAFGLFGPRHLQLDRPGNAALDQFAGRQAAVRVARAGHVAHHGGEIEAQYAFVLHIGQRIGPEAGLARIRFHQLHLLGLAAGQAQIVQRLFVDGKQRSGGTVFGAHIGNGGAVANRQTARTLAVEFEVGTHHFFLAQEFGQRQHHIGRGNARLAAAGQLHADDIGQAHPGSAAQHHVLGLQSAHAHCNHAQRVHVRRVAVGTDAGIGKSHPVLHIHHGRHLFQIDLVHDTVPGRDHIDIGKCLFRPINEVKAVFVAAILDGAVFGECVRHMAATLHRQRMVHDQLHRHHRVDGGRIASLLGNGIAQTGQIHQRGLAQNVVTHHAHRVPRKIPVAAALDQLAQAVVHDGRIRLAHDVFRMHACGVRQSVPGARLQLLHGGTRIKVAQRRTGKGFFVFSIHGRMQVRRLAPSTSLGEAGSRSRQHTGQGLHTAPCRWIKTKLRDRVRQEPQPRASIGTKRWSSGPV